MSNATMGTTIRQAEAAHFGALAADWWDPKGASAMLHRLNPVRLGFIREAIDSHWGGDPRAARPLSGKRALDAGCGAGLLCEPLARLGAAVTGIDAAQENIEAARAHAEAMGLLSPLPFRGGAGGGGGAEAPRQANIPHPNPSPEGEGLSGTISYACGEIAGLGLAGFDLVCALEVIEHVADQPAFIAALAAAMQPDGLMILSTPNRTARSRLLLVGAAERFGAIPRGTHRWDDLVTPGELRELLAGSGLEMGAPRGIGWSPAKGLHLSRDMSLDFIVSVRKC